jgi:hypothetical protein
MRTNQRRLKANEDAMTYTVQWNINRERERERILFIKQ